MKKLPSGVQLLGLSLDKVEKILQNYWGEKCGELAKNRPKRVEKEWKKGQKWPNMDKWECQRWSGEEKATASLWECVRSCLG